MNPRLEALSDRLDGITQRGREAGYDVDTPEQLVVEMQRRLDATTAALVKIDAIRNDIVGRQAIGWSRHIYPLVAALKEAGFEGETYETAREKIK